MTVFTGIIEETGRVLKIQKGTHSAVLTIEAKEILKDVKVGDSIAVNGVCLTVTSYGKQSFTADVMHETINRCAFCELKVGNRVNLERAMPANGRFGGHIVAGHVDGVGRIVSIRSDENAIWYTIQASPSIMRYIVEKGSIAIDGISLTVATVCEDRFAISAIPHTVKMTVLQERKTGDLVNLENDVVGKYVERFLQSGHLQAYGGSVVNKAYAESRQSPPEQTITLDFLQKCGY